MNKVVNLSLITVIAVSSLYAQEAEDRSREPSVRKVIDGFNKVQTKDVDIVEQFKQMFTKGKMTGQIRSMYAGYYQENDLVEDSHATAVGGMLKYELASLHGFNAGFAFTTSHDIGLMTGSGENHNAELSSQDGDYTELTEAYLNYNNSGLNIRLGRQVLDTPLADSDDVRMVQNTFEAYVGTYEISDFTFMGGNIQSWQGADTGLGYFEDNEDAGKWVDTGPDGVWLAGATYSGALDANAWYYDISKPENATNIVYLDMGSSYEFSKDITLYGSIQYLNESEVDNSGVEAEIYGALVEFEAYGLGFNVAYNKSVDKEGKRSFSGVGGGTLYTSMDTMILDEITEDREVDAFVTGVVYRYNNFGFLYAYGSFEGGENSLGEKAHIVEQDMGMSYSVNDEFEVAMLYVIEQDKESKEKNENDWNRAQVIVKYDF